MPTARAQKEEDRRKGFIIILALIGLAALIWLASTLGWLQIAPATFAGGDSGGGETAGDGGVTGGGGPVVSIGLSGEIQVGVGGSATTDAPGCFLGFICANASVGAEGNRTDASVDDEGVSVEDDN